MSDTVSPPIERAAAAALALAGERPWREITLAEIANRAEVSPADLWTAAPGKLALMDWLSRRFDLAAFKVHEDAGTDIHDRLFEAVMGRVEVMEPHRAALLAVAAEEGPAPALRRVAWTSRALVAAGGLNADGRKGVARTLAMGFAWTRVVRVWRDDEGALNRTMAEIDSQLRRMREGLGRIGAGF